MKRSRSALGRTNPCRANPLCYRLELSCCGEMKPTVKKSLQRGGKFIPRQAAPVSINGRILD